jgi:hypothetical protein
VEKGSAQWEDLRAAGADDALIAVIDALAERDGEPEADYLARCAASPLALRIKRADVLDKLQVSMHDGLDGPSISELRTRARLRLDLLERMLNPAYPLRR